MKKETIKQKLKHIISWIKRLYGVDAKPEKTPNTQKTKRSYNSTKIPEYDDEHDAAVEDELVAISLLENDGKEN